MPKKNFVIGKLRNDKYLKHKIFLILICLTLNTVVYKGIQILRPSGFNVTTWIDSLIPFVPAFVIPYFLYIPVIILPFVIYWKNYKKFKVMALSMATVLFIAVLIYLVFQTSVIRAHIQGNDIFSRGVAIVYYGDEPLNALPSLHVAIPTIATLFIYLWSKKAGLALLPITILIILSTVFIKQHSVFDVFAGLILAFGVFKIRHVFERL